MGSASAGPTSVNRADPLTQFRAQASGRRFAFGVWDCGLLCAEWVRLVRGVDPAAAWRGRYSTELGLARLLKRRGGLVAHFDQCLAGVGIFRTDEPGRGDIAVVETPQGLTGGIVNGVTIMFARADVGLVIRHRAYALTVAAWRI